MPENRGTGGSVSQQAKQFAFLSPPVGPDEIGRLADYRVLQVLGEGGMGIVLLAEDTLLQRPIALKVIKPEFNEDDETCQRFLREARAMAQVKSDHVVTIHQVGQVDETCFIAMELLEGEPLESWLEQVIVPPLDQILRIGRETAQALAAAHTRGLIHRDVKPGNIWLEAYTGRVKLLDFGLARPQEGDVRLTTSGTFVGTPAYMAPEQARAATLDARADLFSLGCVLYEMATGRPAFDGTTIMAILIALAEEIPLAPSHYNANVPRTLDDLILRLLAKERENRPATADAVIAELKAIEKTGSQIGAIPFSQIHSAAIVPGAPPPGASIWLQNQQDLSAVAHESPSSQRRRRAREAERRQVTVLVAGCELFQSEKYLEEFDVEVQAELLKDFQKICQDAVAQLDGCVVQCNEDGFLACFGYPIAFEDSARRAGKTALTILEKLTVFSEEVRREHLLEFNPWLALHTGAAIVESKDNEVSLVGEARNVAVRLSDVAVSGQIICSDSTHQMLKGSFDCTSLGERKIKGLSHAITLFQVQGLKEAASAIEAKVPVGLTPLTGRDQEMNLLKERWQQAKEGMGQVVLLIGEAGLGKSRLVHALKQYVRGEAEENRHTLNLTVQRAPGFETGQDSSVVEWYCSPHFRNTGLYPVSNFFERFFHFGRHEDASARLDKLVQHLEKYNLAQPDIVPLFASLLSLPTNGKFPSLALTPVREREETFLALKEWLSAYSREQPLLFVIEDLHWLDASTLEFLTQYLAEGVQDQVLTMLTFRPEFRTPWPALPNQTSLPLNRLTKNQVGELMQRKVGSELPDSLVNQVYDRAGGVPLFIEEFTQMVQESGLLEQGKDSARNRTLRAREIPATLQDLIMARLDRMDGDRELAQLAATLGREFSYERIAAVAGVDETMLKTELAKLAHAEILFEKGKPPRSTYIFKHALLEDALYNALMKGKRQQFHKQIASVLESRFPQTAEMQPELLAHHFTEGGLNEKAIDYWLAAGLRAHEQFANIEAICHFKKGLELLPALPESSERDVKELQLLNPLGSAYQASLGYAAPQVGPAFERARELSQRIGETSQLFEVMWGSWTWHLVRGDLAMCMGLADEMIALAHASGDRGITMEAYAAPAVTLYYRADFAGCRDYCQQAIANYEDLELCRLWSGRTGQNSAVTHRCYLSLALWQLGYPDQALKVNEEMIALARQSAHPFTLAHALHFTSWLNQHCRLVNPLILSADEQIALSSEQGFALWLATGTFLKGAGVLLKDEIEESLVIIEKGLKSFRGIAANLTLPAQLSVLGEAYTKAGRFEPANNAFEEGIKLAKEHDDTSQLAELYRLQGELWISQSGEQLAKAEGLFRQAIGTARSQGSKAWELRSSMSLARLMQRQSRQQEARTVLATIYDTYQEGYSTPDLLEAKSLLASLS